MIGTTGKRYFKHKRVLLLVQILLFFVFIANSSASETANIVVDNFPPYINQHQPPGVMTKLVQQIFADKHIQAVIEFKPWSEVETLVDTDKRLSFMWSRTANRTQKWVYSDPLYTNRQVLVVKKGSGVFWRRLDQLRQYKLGVTSHHNYGDNFEQYRQYLDLTESASDFLSLKKLVRGQVDGIITEELTGRHLISFFPDKVKQQLEVLGHKALDTSNSYLVCSKHYAKCLHFIQKFNQGLKQLKESSQYQTRLKEGF